MMVFTPTTEERELLSILGREAERQKLSYESAVRDFKLAFDMSMRARGLTNVMFVKLDDEGMHVETPKPQLVQDDPEDAA